MNETIDSATGTSSPRAELNREQALDAPATRFIIKRLGNLLSVKSLVTLALTVVFAVMTVRQAISQDFMTIYAVIIAFYFGTQSQKVQDAVEGRDG